jgi:hypothetical protein
MREDLARPRDLAHLETFSHFHETSRTGWTSPAPAGAWTAPKPSCGYAP